MLEEAIVRYFHFLGILVLVSALVCQHLLMAKEITPAQLKRIILIDRIYGVGALIVLSAGLILWFSVGKPPSFYSGNFVFHIKFTLFLLAALISAIPTIFYLKQQKSTQNIIVPKSIISRP
ncbi:DUF2214 family protein [Aliikangiella maris]|uniref:DUF2214 family protein n=2 Tax=Aliikangiella maris TaxID=3162458 RepID=A0ABV2C060_9GAMM